MDVLCASWRLSTRTQYGTYIKKWQEYCRQETLNSHCTAVESVIEFLSYLFHVHKLSYSAINCARSALASVVLLENSNCTISTHPLVTRFMKGVFHLRTPLPRYNHIWDVKIVLDHLRKMSPASKLSLCELTHKLCMLLALTSAQRAQTLFYIHIDGLVWKDNSVEIHVSDLVKQNKTSDRVGSTTTIEEYPSEKRLCVVRYLKKYIERTKVMRDTERHLFICYRKPHKRASKQTISRWIKETMSAAGIDTRIFKPHSTRAAAVSTAKTADVPIADILKQAGWSNEETFNRFYDKPSIRAGPTCRFSMAVLDNH